MIQVAICDDNMKDTERMEDLLMQLQPRIPDKIQTSIFYSGTSFCEAIKDSCLFDIVLMDIEMNGIDGIMAGQKLRMKDENDMVLLLYISSHDGYLRELFDVQPYAFLEKPIIQNEFFQKTENALRKIMYRRKEGKIKVLPVAIKGGEVLIPLKKILYLESKIRKICAFTVDGSVEYYGKLKMEEQKLPNSYFVRTHQSYIINFNYIKEITNETITLTNHTKIPISSSRCEDVKVAYMAYWRNHFE